MKIFNSKIWRLLPWVFGIAFVWFIPWVFILKLGILIYFPYKPNGSERYIRITGPFVGLVSTDWVDNKNIPPFCKAAAVAAEDEKFYKHYGIDIESIQASIKDNKRTKKMKRGASTITQQIVKKCIPFKK